MNVAREMDAMVLEEAGKPLRRMKLKVPEAGQRQVLLKVNACGICRTDLHIVDGELARPKLPLILGHEIVGQVVKLGNEVQHRRLGEVVGVPWLGYSCGHCRFCRKDKENLCENALFTGYTFDGGFAEYALADERFTFPLAPKLHRAETAPLLCAGLIGYRTYAMAGCDIEHIGIYGFGAAAHILIQLAVHQNKKVYAFTREGDVKTQEFARKLGAVWAGASTQTPPRLLDAALIFAPAGNLVPKALQDIEKGGSVVCGGIHMSDIPGFPYALLWGERILRSVANLSRRDGKEFLKLLEDVPIRTEIRTFALHQANEALEALRSGNIQGAAVLVMT